MADLEPVRVSRKFNLPSGLVKYPFSEMSSKFTSRTNFLQQFKLYVWCLLD